MADQPWVQKDKTEVSPDPHPEVDHGVRRYKHRDLEIRCYCDDCRIPAQRAIAEYRARVKREVKAGRREPPEWMRAAHRASVIKSKILSEERARNRDRDLHRAAIAIGRVVRAFPDQLEMDREYLPMHANRRAQVLIRIYVDETAAGKWRERGAGG